MAKKSSDGYIPIKERLAGGAGVLDLPRQIKMNKSEIDALPFLPKGLKTSTGKPINRLDFLDIDNKNFGIRVSAKTKTFFVKRWVRAHGKETRVTIGVYGLYVTRKDKMEVVTPDLAKTIALETISELREGIDVNVRDAKAKSAKKQADQQAEEVASKELTVNKLAAEYLEKHAKVNKRESSVKEDERLLEKDILPLWGQRKAKDIRKRDVVLLLETMSKRGPALTHNIFKLVRKMFNFAVERDILEFTPCTGIKIDNIATITSRDRVLRDAKANGGIDEILIFWTELEKASMSVQVKNMLKFILLTGQRPGEVAGINENEITVEQHEENGRKWEETWWTIPVARRKVKEKSKNPPQPHRVFLSKMALEILGTQPVGGYYFPSPVAPKTPEDKQTHIDENAVAYAIRRNLKDYQPRRAIKGKTISMVKVKEERKMEIDHFTPHDLRRTFSTRLAGLGFSDEINDAVLGHVKTGVVGIYNRYQYDREKKAAMEAWERKLKAIITGKAADNVLPMKKKAK